MLYSAFLHESNLFAERGKESVTKAGFPSRPFIYKLQTLTHGFTFLPGPFPEVGGLQSLWFQSLAVDVVKQEGEASVQTREKTRVRLMEALMWTSCLGVTGGWVANLDS